MVGLLGIIFIVFGGALLFVVEDSRRPHTVGHRFRRTLSDRR
jgi:hypothetical protein